mmetsp:Transcript_9456/g.28875  ORF Transcript_9456/g.28875 Transcript_9456/m.28875 type:complete len:291 (-) Transcript_9456:333-1205(-)
MIRGGPLLGANGGARDVVQQSDLVRGDDAGVELLEDVVRDVADFPVFRMNGGHGERHGQRSNRQVLRQRGHRHGRQLAIAHRQAGVPLLLVRGRVERTVLLLLRLLGPGLVRRRVVRVAVVVVVGGGLASDGEGHARGAGGGRGGVLGAAVAVVVELARRELFDGPSASLGGQVLSRRLDGARRVESRDVVELQHVDRGFARPDRVAPAPHVRVHDCQASLGVGGRRALGRARNRVIFLQRLQNVVRRREIRGRAVVAEARGVRVAAQQTNARLFVRRAAPSTRVAQSPV